MRVRRKTDRQPLGPAPIETVLFDFDGTLVDASEAICGAFAAVLRARGLPPMPEPEVRAMIGRPLREMFVVAGVEDNAAELEACLAIYRTAFFPIAVARSRLMPTAGETIARLRQRALKLGVVTSRLSDGADRILEAMELRHCFDVIIGLEHVQKPKPDPEPVLVALARLGVSANRAVMVGDTPDDVIAGRRAGGATVGVTTGVFDADALAAAGADVVVERLAELAELLSG